MAARKNDDGKPRSLAVGLRLAQVGVACVLLVVLAGFSMACAVGIGHSGAQWFMAALILALGLEMAGRLQCLWAPASGGSRGWIVGSVAGEAVGLGIWYARAAAPLTGRGPPAEVVNLLALVHTLAGVALFLVFVRRLAAQLGRPDLDRLAGRLMVLSVALAILFLAAAVRLLPVHGDWLPRQPWRRMTGAATVGLLLRFVLLLVFWSLPVLYVRLLHQLARVTSRSSE